MELLVALFIIGVLLALILPAVQQAREAARQTQCKNNLRQLGLALQNYESAHSVFPINYGLGAYSSSNRGASWLQLILPSIDQNQLYQTIQFGRPLYEPANTSAAQRVIGLFRCPSDTHDGLMGFRSNVPGTWAVNNYKACAGSNWGWGAFSPVVSKSGRNANDPDGLDSGNGFMFRGAGRAPCVTRAADLRDGASSTFALGEAVPEWCRHTWWYWFNASTATCAIPPNYRKAPDTQVAMEGDWWHNYSFHSRHPGGLHMAYADGRVAFLSDGIDLDVYRAMATIAGQEAVTPP